LKRANRRFADAKSWADVRLRRAKKFDVDLAGFLERAAHGVERELGCVAIAAEMAKHDAINFSGQQFLDHRRGSAIGEMSVPGLDPLLYRPGTMGVALQKFFVVIRFDDERVHLAQSFHDHFGCVAEIGDEPETTRTGVKREPDGIDRVVRHRESLHGDVANLELGAGPKDSPIPMSIQRTVGAHRFGRLRIRVDGNVEFAAKNFQTANVIAMFVREQNAVDLLRINAALLETKSDLARAEAAVDQNPAMIGRHERAVSGAAAPEHRQTKHAGI
jgi:hypothetical protein